MDKIKTAVIGTAAAAGLGALSLINYRRFMPAAKPLNDKNYKVKVTPYTIQSGGRKLYGELLTPEGVSGPLPTVICSHGYCSSYRLTKAMIGKPLAMSGWAAFCFDFGGGAPKRCKSTGSFRNMTIFREKDDLLAVIDFVRELDTTDAENLFLLGESQGGMISAITAPDRAEVIKAMVLYYPAFCIPDDARSQFASKEAIPDEVTAFRQKIGGDYFRSTYDFDVFGYIRGYTGPVLIMHGDNDDLVPCRYGQMGAEAYEDCEFHLFPGEVHGWTGKGKRKAAEMSYAFMKKQG